MTPKEGREEVVDTVDLAVEAEGWEVASAVPDDGESLVVVLDPNDGRAPDGMRGGFNAEEEEECSFDSLKLYDSVGTTFPTEPPVHH